MGARCSMIAEDCEAIVAVLEIIKIMSDDGLLTIARCKDRFTSPNWSGWADIMLNIQLPTGAVAEIQIVHRKLQLMREKMDGHDDYAAARAAVEISIMCDSTFQTLVEDEARDNCRPYSERAG